MEAIRKIIEELETQLKGEFFEDLYTQQAINYWERQMQYEQNEVNKNP